MNGFLSLGRLELEAIDELLALAARLERSPEPRALAGRLLGLLFFDPSVRTLASMQAAMSRLGGDSFVVTAGSGSWKIETRRGVVMDGAAAEHAREAVPVLAGYCDVLGIRCFAGFTDLEEDLSDRAFLELARLSPAPVVNLESAIDHPCQALGDWRTLDELGVPRDGKLVLSWANHPKPLPLAVPAAVAEMAALRGMAVTVLRPESHALPEALVDRLHRAAARGGGTVFESGDRDAALEGADAIYAKSWAASVPAAAYGDAETERALRAELADWCVAESWFARARPEARLLHCLPVRRNVVVADEVLDGPRSAVVRQAHNRMWVQMAVLHRLLGAAQRRAA
jgi:N-acetylornithine carbamoyltransferase